MTYQAASAHYDGHADVQDGWQLHPICYTPHNQLWFYIWIATITT